MSYKKPKRNYAFVDGSYNPDTKVYGGGGVLVDQYGNRHLIFESGKNPRMAKLRNVAGEMLGAQIIVEKALALGMKKLMIFHDYEGVANWVTGRWKCRKPETQTYANRIHDIMRKGLKITFKHVKGHSGILENEEVDRLAKMVVGIFKK